MDVIQFVSILQGGKIIHEKEIEMIEIIVKVGIYLCIKSDDPRLKINVSRIDLIENLLQKQTEMAEAAEADSVGREIGDEGGEKRGDKRNVIEIGVRMTCWFSRSKVEVNYFEWIECRQSYWVHVHVFNFQDDEKGQKGSKKSVKFDDGREEKKVRMCLCL